MVFHDGLSWLCVAIVLYYSDDEGKLENLSIRKPQLTRLASDSLPCASALAFTLPRSRRYISTSAPIQTSVRSKLTASTQSEFAVLTSETRRTKTSVKQGRVGGREGG